MITSSLTADYTPIERASPPPPQVDDTVTARTEPAGHALAFAGEITREKGRPARAKVLAPFADEAAVFRHVDLEIQLAARERRVECRGNCLAGSRLPVADRNGRLLGKRNDRSGDGRGEDDYSLHWHSSRAYPSPDAPSRWWPRRSSSSSSSRRRRASPHRRQPRALRSARAG